MHHSRAWTGLKVYPPGKKHVGEKRISRKEYVLSCGNETKPTINMNHIISPAWSTYTVHHPPLYGQPCEEIGAEYMSITDVMEFTAIIHFYSNASFESFPYHRGLDLYCDIHSTLLARELCAIYIEVMEAALKEKLPRHLAFMILQFLSGESKLLPPSKQRKNCEWTPPSTDDETQVVPERKPSSSLQEGSDEPSMSCDIENTSDNVCPDESGDAQGQRGEVRLQDSQPCKRVRIEK